MKMTLDRKILLGFIACALILFGVAIFSFKNSEKFIASNVWVDHTNQVLNEFEQILISSIDAETGTRGFIITGDEKFLEPFSDANTRGVEHLDKVRELTKDNPIQQKNIEELEKEFKMHFDYFNRSVELRKKDFEKARELVASGEGKRMEDEIRKIIDRAEEIEHRLLAERKLASEDDAKNFNSVFVILLLIIIIILIIVYIIVTSNLKALKKAEAETADKNWLLTGSTELNEKLKGDQSLEDLANNTISFLCTYMKASVGAVYQLNDKDNTLVLSGQYAFSSIKDIKQKFTLNEGLIGQAAREKKQISLSDITDEHIRITSSVLNAKPKHLLITPFLFEGKIVGVIEIGSLTVFREIEKEFIITSMDSIAIRINSAIARKRIQELLLEAQVQSEELQAQQEELKQMNEELEEQTQNLKQQQEELQMTNEELEEQTQSLEIRNKEVETAKTDIEQKTKQLEISSKLQTCRMSSEHRLIVCLSCRKIYLKTERKT
jgi:CHASE3 domain sensor protein/putative methionine-R-sulfoxide reductase with GAF domain